MLLYYFAKFACKVGLRVNFKKLYLHYQEELPKDKPIIFAVNHPTAFIDPVFIGAFLDRPTYFIVRGDIFKGKLILAILRGLKMLPIFRFRDGYSNLKNNHATMETVYNKIADDKCILVLAEGQTKHEKRLRPIQKGTARMAMGAIEAHGDLDVLIVPTGVNYTDSDAFRSFIMTEVGKPIYLRDYKTVYEENPRKAVKQITDRIEKEMRGLVIHIENEADDDWINRLLELQRNNFDFSAFPVLSEDSSLWKAEFEAVEIMNAFSENQNKEVQALLDSYDGKLKTLKVTDKGVAESIKNNRFKYLLLDFGLIPFLIGYVLNIIPMYLAEMTAKSKVKKIEFYSSVRYGAGLVLYLIYWLILLIVCAIIVGFTGNYWWFLLLLAVPVLGYFALIYRDVFQLWNARRKFRRLKKTDQKELKNLRKQILAFLG